MRVKRILQYIIVATAFPMAMSAQETDEFSNDIDPMEMPESMTARVGSLLKQRYARQSLSFPTTDCQFDEANNLPVSDSVYAERLVRIPSLMELPFNDVVKKYIDQYTVKMRGTVAYMLGAMNFYMPMFEEAIDLEDLPNELK